MTNSRSESATRNKKRRVEFVDDAPEEATRARNSVVDQTDPLKLVGSRLEPIHGLLESQPPSLQTNIIRLTKLMLEKLDKINLRISNCTRFTQPVKNPKTGNILKDKEDQAVKFVPQSLRAACPIKASNKFIIGNSSLNSLLGLIGNAARKDWGTNFTALSSLSFRMFPVLGSLTGHLTE